MTTQWTRKSSYRLTKSSTHRIISQASQHNLLHHFGPTKGRAELHVLATFEAWKIYRRGMAGNMLNTDEDNKREFLTYFAGEALRHQPVFQSEASADKRTLRRIVLGEGEDRLTVYFLKGKDGQQDCVLVCAYSQTEDIRQDLYGKLGHDWLECNEKAVEKTRDWFTGFCSKTNVRWHDMKDASEIAKASSS